MNIFITNLYKEMKASLEEIAISSGNILHRAEQSYVLVQEILAKLKEHILSYSFKDEEEEIRFFKNVKPMFLQELIFFEELYYIELNRPLGSISEQEDYLLKALEGIRIFFERNRLLYAYHRTGKTMYDELFFRRESNKSGLLLLPEYALDIDIQFSTLTSCKLARMQAFEQLREEIQLSLYRLTGSAAETVSPEKDQCIWTDTEAALTEVGYALHAKGSINHGKAPISMIMSALERAFNKQLGNYYRAFQNMRLRKKRTAYMVSATESLARYMDETDMNF